MASDLDSTLKRLAEKSRFMTERFKVVTRQRDEAIARIAELEKELHERDRRLESMQTELEYLKVSSVLSPTSESVAATRAIIKGLISDIDRCIADIRD
ncbi:MAG: hypothetical protein J1F20_01305 [Muribaculaceae bacterium]|nr:hypothetical protein [Muribaculaceae bacterium]